MGAPSAQTDSSYTVTWTPREMRVEVFYTAPPYDCDYLHDDLQQFLLQLGARASDLNIDMSPCHQGARDGDWLVKAEVKLSVLAPPKTTAQDAPSAPLQARWKTVEMPLDNSPRDQVLTNTRLNHYIGLGFRNQNRVFLLKTQILPLFLTQSVEFRKDGSSLRVQVLQPLEDPAAGR